jgi:hypothetical protein
MTNTANLNSEQLATVRNALVVAALKFDANAAACVEMGVPGMAEQFKRQATESRALLTCFDEPEVR